MGPVNRIAAITMRELVLTEALRFRMDLLGMTRKDLEAMLSGHGKVSEILARKRALSLELIRLLHKKLHIPLGNLIGTAA